MQARLTIGSDGLVEMPAIGQAVARSRLRRLVWNTLIATGKVLNRLLPISAGDRGRRQRTINDLDDAPSPFSYG